MASTDGSRRVRTYGKSKVKVASSHRDWLASVHAGAGAGAASSTSSSGPPLTSARAYRSPASTAAPQAAKVDAIVARKLAMASRREEGKRHTDTGRTRVLEISSDASSDSDDAATYGDTDTDVEMVLQTPPPVQKKTNKTTRRSSSIIPHANNNKNDADDRSLSPPPPPATGSLKSTTGAPAPTLKAHSSTASVESSTSTASGSSVELVMQLPRPKRALAGPARRPFVVESPPSVAARGVVEGGVQTVNRAAPAARTRPAILSRKDSNTSSVGYTGDAKQPGKGVHPVRQPSTAPATATTSRSRTQHPVVATESCSKGHARGFCFCNGSSSSSSSSSSTTRTSTTANAFPKTPARRTTSTKTAKPPSRLSLSSGLSVAPPRGHGAQATAPWRRPLTPVPPVRSQPSGLPAYTRQQQQQPFQLKRPAAPGTPTVLSRSHRVELGQIRQVPIVEVARRRPPSSTSMSTSTSTASTTSSGPSKQNTPVYPAQLTHSVRTPRQAKANEYTAPALATKPETNDIAHSVPDIDSIVASAPGIALSTPPSATASASASTLSPGQDIQELLQEADPISPLLHDFTDFVTTFPLRPDGGDGATIDTVTWRKLGEATYSEVYVVTCRTRETVVKIIPLCVPTPTPATPQEQVHKELPQTSYCGDVKREIAISRALATTHGYPQLKVAYVVKGSYPDTLLAAWDAFRQAAPRSSENIRPDVFAADQMFAIICLTHGGLDLENVKLKTWQEAVHVLWQVADSLGRAEQALQFEHRDLHWGNILVRSVQPQEEGRPPSNETVPVPVPVEEELPACLRNSRPTVQATIIDFTLSRMTWGDQAVSGGLEDETIFEGQGDYQYDCYRLMRRLVKDDWSAACPATNVVWLHYLAQKLLKGKKLRKPAALKPSVTTSHHSPLKVKLPTRGGGSKSKSATLEKLALETAAWEGLHAAEAALSVAVDAALQRVETTNGAGKPRRSRNGQGSSSDRDTIRSAGDFVQYWRHAV